MQRPFNPNIYPLPSKKWDPKYQLKGFETLREAEFRNQYIIKTLLTETSFSTDLRHRLSQCLRGNRCGSGACQVCLRRMRRILAGAEMGIFKYLGWQQGMGLTASVVPDIQFPLGDLDAFDIARESGRIRTRLVRSCLADQIIIGGWDFSVNESSTGITKPFWQPHLYLMIPTVSDFKQAKEGLHKVFPSGGTVLRPVRTRVLTDPISAITYSYKAIFRRRVAYIDGHGHLNNRNLPLRPESERELRVFLDHIGFTGRLFLRNVRRRGSQLLIEDTSSRHRNQPAKVPISP